MYSGNECRPPLLVRGFSLFSTGLEEGRKNTLCKGSAFLGRAFCVYDFFKIGALPACLFKAGFAPSPLGKVRAGLPRRKFAVRHLPLNLPNKKGGTRSASLFFALRRWRSHIRRAAKNRLFALYLPPRHWPCKAQCAQLQPQEDFPFFFWL